MMEILAATGNPNKLAELTVVGREFGLQIVSPEAVRTRLKLGAPPVVDEDQVSFIENARKKARSYHRWSGMPTIGDDSGLEVQALGGRPGIMSQRYESSDEKRIERIIAEVKEIESQSELVDRRAAFRCALVLITAEQELDIESAMEGELLFEPRGTGGFGYDPIVYFPQIRATLAEVDFEITCKKGFRAAAARKLFSEFCRQGFRAG